MSATLRSHRAPSVLPARRPLRAATLANGVLLLLAPCALADSVTSTWQGGASGNWSTAANWSPSATAPNNGNGGNIYIAILSSATVTLTEAIAVDGLSLTDTTLAGAYTLTSGYQDLTLAGSNTLSAGLALYISGPFAFANSAASLSNHGTLQFNISDPGAYSASSAVLTNASDGVLRFNPSSYTYVGDPDTSPFNLLNQGTVLADNGTSNYVYVPVSQTASGLIRATGSGSSLYLQSGGTLAGTLQANAGSTLYLTSGLSAATYTLDQTAVSGSGSVLVGGANLTGSLASGSLQLYSATFSGAFTNQSGATLLWESDTAFASGASLTNHGILQFDISSSDFYYPSSAVLTNASDGVLRFNPSSYTYVGSSSASPFNLLNQGTVLADNGTSNYVYVPVSQTASGLIRATGSGSTLYLRSGGTLAGTLQADAGASLSLTSDLGDATYTLNQAAVIGNVHVGGANLTGSLASGSLQLYSATLSGTFTNQSGATLLWESDTAFASGASLTNHGILQFDISGSDFYYPSSSVLTNASDGVLRFSPTSYTYVGDSDTSPFNLLNQGTVLADNGTSNYLYVPVTQTASGLIRATGSGSTLYLRSGGTLAGTLQADAGASLSLTSDLGDATYTLDQTAVIGNVHVSGANLTGSLASGSLQLYSATLSGAFTNQASATLRWGSYTGFAPGAALINHGTLQFESSGFDGYLPSSSVLTNASDGVFRFSPTSYTYVGDSDTSPFNLLNQGTVLADNGTSNYLYVPVTQTASGLIRATGSGSTLYLKSGGTLAGTLRADAGATLSLTSDLGDATYTLDQAAVIGNVHVGGANLTGSLASGALQLYSATFSGAFTNHAGATLLWDYYTSFAPSSSLTNHGTLQFNIGGFASDAYSPSSSVLTNASGGVLRFHPDYGVSVGDSDTSPFNLANQGTLLADNGTSNYLYAPVANSGLVRVTSGSSLSLLNGFVQTAGEVRVESASLSAAPGQTLDFQGGLLRASGTLGADVSLADTTLEIGSAQSAGQLSVYGDVALLSGASVSFDLNGPSQGLSYDYLFVNDNVTLGGDLAVRLSSAFAATIAPTDEFIVLSATSIGGSFANVQSGERIALSGGAGSFLVTITGTQLKLGGFSAVPEPASAALLSGLGAGSLLALRRRRSRRL